MVVHGAPRPVGPPERKRCAPTVTWSNSRGPGIFQRQTNLPTKSRGNLQVEPRETRPVRVAPGDDNGASAAPRTARVHRSSVQRVTDDRMTDPCEVHAELVRAAGQRRQQDEGEPARVPAPGVESSRRAPRGRAL